MISSSIGDGFADIGNDCDGDGDVQVYGDDDERMKWTLLIPDCDISLGSQQFSLLAFNHAHLFCSVPC